MYVNSQRTNLVVDTNWLHLEIIVDYEHNTFDLDLSSTTTTFLSEQPLLCMAYGDNCNAIFLDTVDIEHPASSSIFTMMCDSTRSI